MHEHQFLSRAKKIHNQRYEYDLSDTNWVGSQSIVSISCSRHGVFKQTATAHIHQKQGCPKCGRDKANSSRRVPFDEFLEHARLSRVEKFTYYANEWKGMEEKTIVGCPIHGDILVHPRDHLKSKTGCHKCGNDLIGSHKRLSMDDFLKKANAIFDHKYDYSETIYRNNQSLIKIICPEHGPFERRVDKHFLGRGCPRCKLEGQTSKISQKWLDGLRIKTMIREYRLPEKRLRVVDGFDPLTNTVYQFHGDFWHGNPHLYREQEINPVTGETMGRAFDRTMRLDDEIRNLGYNLVIQWENGVRKL